MQIVVHVSGFYNWLPVPTGVEVTEADKLAKRVKPDASGGWLMRVPQKNDSHTDIRLPESQLIAQIVSSHVRDHETLTRAQAASHYVLRHVLPHHAHKAWAKRAEVHDSGPDEALLRSVIAEHVVAGNIQAEDVEDIVTAYLQPTPVTINFGGAA